MRPTLRSLALLVLLATALLGGCSNDQHPTSPVARDPAGLDKGIPAGYYDAVNATSAATLRTTLHAVIDDHLKIPYTSTSTDTWNVVEAADTDPADSGRVLDVYLNASFPKYGEGNLDYNREHVWAKSYGFPNDGASNYPYTDCHHLFICNDSYNSSRGNKPYGLVGGSGTEYPTQLVGGVGGGTGVYPGWSNWSDVTYWETWWDRRGDVARALLYMDVRYEGGTHGVTGYAEPNLILTDNLAQIEASNTGSNETTAYMGLLATVLQWHLDDPVDAKEQARNDAVYAYQGNRNPFIDHPEWVACLFTGSCGTGDTTPPAAPTGLVATAGTGAVTLDWADNTEADLAGYTVYRATAAAGPFSPLNGALLANSAYTDNAVTGGTTYWYRVTADDVTGNESAASATASATPTGGGGGGGAVVWINEIHYDNDGTDAGELVEVCGTAGTSLSGWSVVGYNGSGGAMYLTVNLSGTLADQLSGFGTASFAFAGMQNGSPDGLALVNNLGQVAQFLSYEGTFSATDGPAAGTASTDIGVSQTGTSAVGWTLQLAGSGTTYSAFTWQPVAAGTPGAVNTGQTFGYVPPPNVAPVAEANGPYAALTAQSITFSSAGSADSDGTIVAWSWNFGDGATATTANPAHAYAAAGSFTATLTVTDDDGAQHSDTAAVTITAPNVAPVAQANGPYSGTTGASIAFSSAGSTDSDGTITAWSWNFGDGATSTAANPTHAYAAAGSYTATLTVTDDDGAQHSDTAPVTVTAPALANVWINEFHYDNAGTDSGELVELAGPAGTSLAGWTLLAYNGADGTVYMTKALTGTFTNLQAGYGVLSFAWTGLQNGAPDGFALVNASGQVVQFLSYEGTFTAVGGAASGMTSTAIPVSESEATVKGYSCQLQGTGDRYVEFTWKAGVKATAGKKNTLQTFAVTAALAFN